MPALVRHCTTWRHANPPRKPIAMAAIGVTNPAAGVIATLVWVWAEYLSTPTDLPVAIPGAVLTVVLGVLMISNVKYFSPKSMDRDNVPFVYMLGIVVLFTLVFYNPPLMLLVIGSVYAVSGPIQALMRKGRHS